MKKAAAVSKSAVCAFALAGMVLFAGCGGGGDSGKGNSKPEGTVETNASSKDDDILKLLNLSGTMSEQFVDVMTAQFKPLLPNANWAEILKKADFDGLLNECIPIYDKYFTHDEIKQLIKFYESPVGKKSVEKAPLMMGEIMTVSQQWGEKKLAPVIQSEMKRK